MKPQHGNWSEAEIDALLAREDFRYQRVELPHGRATGGYDRTATARAVLPDDLGGRSVLDLGCNYGFFCFEAKKRGAARVVGIDVDPESIRKARLLADCLGLDVEFRLADIERDPLGESFDHVLCLNLLHHLRDPIGALDRLVRATRERLVLEVATLGRHDRRKLGLSPLARWIAARLPVLWVGRSRTRAKREVQKFYITPAAIENLLIWQRGQFASLDILPSEHKGRFLAIAHRRRIGHLLVVAGPTACGKKTFERRLLEGGFPEIAGRLGTPDPSVWGEPVPAIRLTEPGPAVRARMLLHYDTMRPFTSSAHVFARDEALDILETAERVSVITLWTPPERLAAQLAASEAGSRRASRRHRRIAEFYTRPQAVAEHYRQWLAFVRERADELLVIDTGSGEVLDPERFLSTLPGDVGDPAFGS